MHTISPVVEQVLLGQNSLCPCTGHHAVNPNRVKSTQEQPQLNQSTSQHFHIFITYSQKKS